MKYFFSLIFILLTSGAWCCATHGKKVDAKQWEAFKKTYKRKLNYSNVHTNKSLLKSIFPVAVAEGEVPKLPFPGGTGNLTPWGGALSSRWRPEAILANAMSLALNEGWSIPHVKDVLVAVPTKFYNEGFHPYGDGQSNTRPSFESWHHSRPPLIASLIKFKTTRSQVIFKFDRAMNLSQTEVEISYFKGGQRVFLKVSGQKKNDDLIATWNNIPEELDWDRLAHTQVVLVRPSPNYDDWFPIYFRHPVKNIDELLLTVPQEKRVFSDGKPIVDGESVKQKNATSPSAFENLMSHRLSQKYNPERNGDPYIPENIHAEFVKGGTVTGVGRGWTWVAEKDTPFKIMYTCFERRQREAEAEAKDGGVASGGGWHMIGDNAETILNSLELEPLAVASGYVNPAKLIGLIPNQYSHNLSDVAIARMLQPGEAFITVKSVGEEQNHHWYFFQQNREVCTEEWVHPCRPKGTDPDFRCE